MTRERSGGIQQLRLLSERVVRGFLALRVRIDSIKARGVQAENLALVFHRQVHAVLRLNVFWQLEGHEPVDQPLWLPDGVIAAKENLVRPDPEEQVGNDLGKVARARVNERQGYRQPAIDI